MTGWTEIDNFNLLTLPQKFLFFESKIDEVVGVFEEKQLNKFLKAVILNDAENSYIRKTALELFTECVFLEKLRPRQELTILIDEWIGSEVFLEVRRLKDLFYFYEVEPDLIAEIYEKEIASNENEIAAESYYYLGLIEMQKAFSRNEISECIENLNASNLFFNNSSKAIENRVDAEFFQTATSIIIDLLNEKIGDIDNKLKELANILLQREAFSFSEKQTTFHISFYRKLLSLKKIKAQTVSGWLDFRKGFDKLFLFYSELKNQEIENRLNESFLSNIYTAFLDKSFVQPYFAQSFSAEINRINTRLDESDLTPEQKDFLIYIKELAENADLKKKEDEKLLRQRIINAFPFRNPAFIDDLLSKVSDITNTSELTAVYEILSKPSVEKFIDALTDSCLELQGRQIYRGSNLKKISSDEAENLRNDFINSLLNAKGYITRDQTRWSSSHKGVKAGEIDIFVRESDNTLFTIIEALNLDYLNTNYINTHIDKTFVYDANGLKQNFILVYSTATDFIGLWEKYINHIKNHTYKYELVNFQEISDYAQLADIKIGKSTHFRNEQETFLYHVFLNMN
jgi:hypothetical protein